MPPSNNWVQAPGFLNTFGLAVAHEDAHGADDWGNGRFHLSDASSCARKIWYRIMIARYPELLQHWGVTRQARPLDEIINLQIGHAVHGWLQAMLVKLGWCTPADIEVKVALPDYELKGSVDIVLSIQNYYRMCDMLGIPPNLQGKFPGTHIVVDIKTKKDKEEVERITINGKRDKKVTHSFPDDIMIHPSDEYYVQVQSYMGLLPELYPGRYPDIQRGIILYACKNNGAMFAVGMKKDETVLPMVKAKAALLKRHTAEAIPPPREYPKGHGKCQGWPENGALRYACPYYQLCHGCQSLSIPDSVLQTLDAQPVVP